MKQCYVLSRTEKFKTIPHNRASKSELINQSDNMCSNDVAIPILLQFDCEDTISNDDHHNVNNKSNGEQSDFSALPP